MFKTKKGRTAILGATLAAGVAVAAGVAIAADSITFVAWGGTTQERQMAVWGESFTELTGTAVVADGPTDYGKLKAMVESGNVVWDVVDVEADFAYRAAQEGLLEPIDFTVVDKTNLDPRYTFEYGTGNFYYAFVLAYNKEALGGNVPQTWADFFDIEKFPGKRSVIGWPSTGIVEMALLADGVAPEDLYPLDIDRAFAKLATIRDHIVFWNSGAESQQLLASGEAPICFCWDTRVSVLMQEEGGENIGMSWNQAIATGDMLVIPKGSPNKDLAMQFIANATTAENQATFAKAALLSPINLQAVDMLDAETMDAIAFGHLDGQIEIDLNYWVGNADAVTEAWNKWKLQE